MLLLMTLAAIALRQDGPALTPAQGRALRPSALADALLAPGHPPVVEVVVGPEGQMPPPPGMASGTPIRLFSAAGPSSHAGFCEKTVANVSLAAVMPQDRDRLPARPEALSITRLYRWEGKPGRRSTCEGRHYAFFSPDPDKVERLLAVVRLLAEAQRSARAGRALRFAVSVTDEKALANRDFAGRNTDPTTQPTGDDMTPITDGRAALTMVPLPYISWIGAGKSAGGNPLTRADLVGAGGRRLEAVGLFAGGDWTVGIALDGDRIVAIRMRRAIPAPF